MQVSVRVLLLEDNPDDLYLLTEMLTAVSDTAVSILPAERFEQALAKARANPVDIALLDLNVPDSYGLDTFLSFHREFPQVPVIIITGVADFELALAAVKAGAQDYLQKNELTTGLLARAIRYAIERHKTMEALKAAKADLELALDKSLTREAEIKGLLKGARAVLEQVDFATTARKVFDICAELIGATSGYVALLSADGAENEVLFLEAGGLPCTVDPELPMPIRGLRETAYRKNKTVYHNRFMDSEWVQFMPKGHVRLENVLFAPLVLKDKTVGIIGLANKDGDFSDNDARVATGFGELAAIALQNSRNLEKRGLAEKHNTRLIVELQQALADVKKLSGLLPICAHCKKIRDDKGYWKQIEEYIRDHSEAEFSHSICRECAEKHYPDIDLYDDEQA